MLTRRRLPHLYLSRHFPTFADAGSTPRHEASNLVETPRQRIAIMASRTRNPPIREPSVFDNSRNISSVLTGPARDAQVQTYPRADPVDSTRETDTLVVTSTHNFLDWTRFDEATLPPRDNLRKSRRDQIFAPLDRVKLELPGKIGIEGFGGIIESAHSVMHSHDQIEFMESERDILLPPLESTTEKLSQRELERLEVELFDLTKYNGYCEFLTAVTWSEDGESGSVTLYKVNVGPREDAFGIRPVAAMQGVPKSILVSMRTHEKIKRKAVFVPTDVDAQRFKWKANPSRGPTYVKLQDSLSSPPVRMRSPSRERSSSHGHYGSSQVDAHGIKATIPQFVALMHSNRSILEQVQTTHLSLLETGDGDVMPAVTLVKAPRPSSHAGDGVHVAVLMPNEADWADEHIYWLDEAGLTEFRRRKYWDLIERGRHDSRSTSRHSHSRHASPDDRHKSRSRSRHSGHGGSRSRSRHLSLHDIF